MDFHQNIFFYYREPSKGDGRLERQAENNTTKALINVLEHASPLVRKEFLKWLGIRTSSSTIFFQLQKATIGRYQIQKARQKLMLGIAGGEAGDVQQLPHVQPEGHSLPDAGMYDENFVVLVESKLGSLLQQSALTSRLNSI